MIVPQGAATFRQHVLATLATEDAKLTPHSLGLFQQLLEELAGLDTRLATSDTPRAQVAQTHPVCQRLRTIPGLGALTATALVAAVSDATQCKKGRQVAAWLGLVPRHQSTGGTPRLLGISKHGDSSLRQLLVHGARSCLRWGGRTRDRRRQWVRSLLERRGWNRAAVALAHKNARVAGVLMGTEQVYQAAEASGGQRKQDRDEALMPRKPSARCQGSGVMREQGRPACPAPAVVRGLRGRYINQAGTRTGHQGSKAQQAFMKKPDRRMHLSLVLSHSTMP